MQKVPELLAPAGDLTRLKAAVDFGADAVYLAGEAFGMRGACKILMGRSWPRGWPTPTNTA